MIDDGIDCCREYGVHTLFRQKMGDDIASACGQLVLDTKKKERCGGDGDLEDLGGGGKGGCGSEKSSGGGGGKASARVVKRTGGSVGKKQGDEDDGGAGFDLKIEMGKLGENIPGVLVQYSILGLVCWGVYRWVSRVF